MEQIISNHNKILFHVYHNLTHVSTELGSLLSKMYFLHKQQDLHEQSTQIITPPYRQACVAIGSTSKIEDSSTPGYAILVFKSD